MVYGFPAGRTQTQTTPYYTNPTATALGTGLLGLNLYNTANQATGGGLSSGLRSGWDFLTSGFGGPTNTGLYDDYSRRNDVDTNF